MAIKIDRMQIKDKKRGSAKILASFDVNVGPITIRGYDLVQHNNNVFIGEPHNYWVNKQTNEGNRFNYIVYNGPKGQKLREQIERMAKEEYKRRRQAPAPQPTDNDPFGGGDSGGFDFGDDADDDLPF